MAEYKTDAVILAGDSKSLLLLNRKPMVQYVIDALKGSAYINELFVVGNNLEGKVNNALIIPGNSTIYENIMKGAQQANGERILIATSDIPLLTSPIVDNYFVKCSEQNADIYLPFVEKRFAQNIKIQRKYRISLKEGNFRMGYLFLISKSLLNDRKTKSILEEIFEMRKGNIGGIAKFLDFRTKLKFLSMYASKNLSIPFLEKEFNKIFGYNGKIIISENAEIMMDVDENSHLEEISKIINNQ